MDSLALWRRDSLRVGPAGKILVVEDRDKPYERILEALKDDSDLVREPDPASAARRVPDGDFDLLIISLNLAHADGLRLCAQVRSLDRIRHLPILIVDESGDDRCWLWGLDNGYERLYRLSNRRQRTARAGATQVKRKRYIDHLRDRLAQSVEMAILDRRLGCTIAAI